MGLLDLRASVSGLPNDLTSPKRVGDAIPGLFNQHGDNYFVRGCEFNVLAPVARLTDPASGRAMEISSTEPCVQFYTGRYLDGSLTGKSGRVYGPHAALCLECQRYPNGVNAPHLGDTLLRPGQTYRQTTVHAFYVDPDLEP
jgi:aldose 1-epimerase